MRFESLGARQCVQAFSRHTSKRVQFLMEPCLHEHEGPYSDTHLVEPRDTILPVAVGTGSPLHSCTLSGLKWPPAHGPPLPCSMQQARAGSHNGGTAGQAECSALVSSWGQSSTKEQQRAAPAWRLTRLAAADCAPVLLQHRSGPGALAQCLCP